jgi:hypothetical protein
MTLRITTLSVHTLSIAFMLRVMAPHMATSITALSMTTIATLRSECSYTQYCIYSDLSVAIVVILSAVKLGALCDAMTLSIKTVDKMTLSITAFSIQYHNIERHIFCYAH